ncbi:MAG: PEP-CTERM sorting domain-containing protein [Phycisphaera sp.]|nr:PEP-CTERM sorting domain-containing protein [Phycisphaera sp.]
MRLATILISIVLLASTTRASDLLFPIDASTDVTLSHSVSFSGYTTINTVGTTAHPFTADVSQSDRLIWEYMAPAGMSVAVNPNTTDNSMFVLVDYASGNGFGALQDPQPTIQFEFIGLTGTAPTLTYTEARYRLEGEDLQSQAILSFSQPFGFTGFRLITVGPFTTIGTRDYADVLPAQSIFNVSYKGGTIDQQIISFVPEPASAALLMLGGLTVLCRRRNR